MFGHISSWFPARAFGFIRVTLDTTGTQTGADVFFHCADIEFDAAQIVKGSRVSFETVHYRGPDGLEKTKAISIRLAPLSAPLPESGGQ
jgi:cold shock CspA family protein